jgi:hypothetical protein
MFVNRSGNFSQSCPKVTSLGLADRLLFQTLHMAATGHSWKRSSKQVCIWSSVFSGEDFLKSANQKQELPVAAMYNVSDKKCKACLRPWSEGNKNGKRDLNNNDDECPMPQKSCQRFKDSYQDTWNFICGTNKFWKNDVCSSVE